MLGTLTTKSRGLSVKGLFNDEIDYVKRRMVKKVPALPFVNPYKQEWVERVRNAAIIETPVDPDAGLPLHEKKSYLELLANPPFDNSTEAGSRGKSVISRPDIVDYTNRLYSHLGLENVKSRGGRGGEGAAGHKLHFQGTALSLGVADEDALKQAQTVLGVIQDKATGALAKRIKHDLQKIKGVLAPRAFAAAPVAAKAGTPQESESDSDNDSEESDSKYNLEPGAPNSLHSLNYPQLKPIAEKLGIDLTKYPNEKGSAKKLKQAIIASQKKH